jgi:hypothetical protein
MDDLPNELLFMILFEKCPTAPASTPIDGASAVAATGRRYRNLLYSAVIGPRLRIRALGSFLAYMRRVMMGRLSTVSEFSMGDATTSVYACAHPFSDRKRAAADCTDGLEWSVSVPHNVARRLRKEVALFGKKDCYLLDDYDDDADDTGDEASDRPAVPRERNAVLVPHSFPCLGSDPTVVHLLDRCWRGDHHERPFEGAYLNIESGMPGPNTVPLLQPLYRAMVMSRGDVDRRKLWANVTSVPLGPLLDAWIRCQTLPSRRDLL